MRGTSDCWGAPELSAGGETVGGGFGVVGVELTCCTGTHPPNGPMGFWHLTIQIPVIDPAVPAHSISAGNEATKGKSVFAPFLLSPKRPGT